MDADQYLKGRLEPEIAWYDLKSTTNKHWYITCQIAEIVCAAIIPFLAGYAKDGDSRISVAIGVLGVLVAICAGLSSILKFQELWIKYRTTAESLKKEKIFIPNQSGAVQRRGSITRFCATCGDARFAGKHKLGAVHDETE